MSEILQPYLLFPFHWLWVLLIASLAVSIVLAQRLPKAWLVGRCDNCGRPTCSACVDMRTGIELCRSCADVIEGLSSVKVMEALLRTRRQKIASIKQKTHSLKTPFFPGVSYTYYGKTLTGVMLSFLGAGALSLLVWRGPYFGDPRSMNGIGTVWEMLPPAALLIAVFLLSLRAKQPQQEQSKYHVLPSEIRMQEQERKKEPQRAKVETPPDPWKEYEAKRAAEPTRAAEPARAAEPTRAAEPKKAPPKEEVLIGEITKGSAWH